VKRALLSPVRLFQRNQNLLLVLAAFGTILGLATVSGYWLFYRMAYLIGGLVPLSFVWARIQLRGLDVSVERSADRLHVGQQAEARVRVSSRSAFSKLWLEVEDQTDMPGLAARTVVTLSAHGTRNWRASVPCTRRGAFSMGPVRVTTGDPFGLFRFSRSYGVSQTLLVLPQPEDIPHFRAPSAHLPGEGAVRRGARHLTPEAAGIREYQPGDSYNRIHWRSTARLNRLMVKTFEMDPSSNIWVLLDLQAAAHAGEGEESSEEYGVRVAASLANHFLQANRMLGLLACGRERAILEPVRGGQQYSRILEALARARAESAAPLARVLEEEGRRFGRHSTLIVVTPSTDEGWGLALQSVLQQGARVAAVLLDRGSFGSREEGLLPLSALVASGILTYQVRRGDDLSLALGPGGAIGEPASEWQKVGAR